MAFTWRSTVTRQGTVYEADRGDHLYRVRPQENAPGYWSAQYWSRSRDRYHTWQQFFRSATEARRFVETHQGFEGGPVHGKVLAGGPFRRRATPVHRHSHRRSP